MHEEEWQQTEVPSDPNGRGGAMISPCDSLMANIAESTAKVEFTRRALPGGDKPGKPLNENITPNEIHCQR
jgi:hypothetical protein